MICTAHETCSTCPDNATASCPMFIWSMNYAQLVGWIRSEMKEQNISHQKMSDLTGVPKGTIDGLLLPGHQSDVGYYTLSPIVRVLMKRYLASSPCRATALAAKASELSAKDEVISDLKMQLKESRETNSTYRSTISDLRSQVKKLEAAAKKVQK